MDAPARRPFSPVRFDALPERPRRPHPFLELPVRERTLESEPFGTMRAAWRELGEGEPLLLVHGLMTSGYSWRYVIEPLASQYRVIVPDLPGSGQTDKPDRSYAPEALARWIGELIDALGIRGCLAIGNSLGGYLSMRLVLDDPGAVRALVNIHSPAFPDARLRALRAALSVPGTRTLLSHLVRRDPIRWAHRNVHYRDETLKSLEEARVYGEPLATPEGRRAFVRYLHDTMNPAGFARFVSDLASRPFPVPLLLVYAREDPMVPPAMGERLRSLLNGVELHWLEESSHFAQVDSPERLLQVVSPFLHAHRG